jgi:hypothetical protein
MIRVATVLDIAQFVTRVSQGEFETDPITPTNSLHMYDFLTEGIRRLNGVVFVYISGNEVKGIIGGYTAPYMYNFDVIYSYEAIRMCKKGEGIARQLIRAFEDWSYSRGATRIVLTEYYSYTSKRLDEWMSQIDYKAVQQTYIKEV